MSEWRRSRSRPVSAAARKAVEEKVAAVEESASGNRRNYELRGAIWKCVLDPPLSFSV